VPVTADPPPEAPRTLWGQLALVCITQFMAWAGFGAILPYLPLFLKDEAHAPVWMIGVVASAYFVGTIAFSGPFGALSDRVGRKPVLLLGVTLYTVATFLFVTTSDPLWFLLFRFIEGVGAAATGPAGNAFVADITTDASRSAAFGWLTTAQFGGLVAGPIVGSVIVAALGGGMRGFHSIFLICSATMAVIGVALAIFMREPEHVARRRREKRRRPPLRKLATPPIVAFIVIAATGHFAMGAWEVTWSIWLEHLGASLFYISLTWAAFSAPMLLSFVGGIIADRGNRFWLMFSGYVTSACIWIAYGSTKNLTLFLVLSVIEGLAVAWSFPAKAAFLVQVSPRRWLGTIQGMETTSMQIAAFVGTLTAPFIYGGFEGWRFIPAFDGVGGFAIGVGGIVSLVGLSIAAPTLHREWGRIKASGEVLSAKEAELLAASEGALPVGSPVDDAYQL
jgi:MFS family permease